MTAWRETRLLTCDRPYAREEWRDTPTKAKWQTLVAMKFAKQGQKTVRMAEEIPRESAPKAPPARSNPPPPPPATYGQDRREAEGEPKGSEPEGKGKPKGKSGTRKPKGGKALAQVNENDDDRRSQHTNRTARQRDWGSIKSQEEWDHKTYQDPDNWEMRGGSWKRKSRGQQWADSQRGDSQQNPRFGEYADWSYGDVLTYKAVYAKYMISDADDIQCPAK